MKPREPRRKVLVNAAMRAGGAKVDVCIRDISSRGMLIESASPPVRGTYIEIIRSAHTVVARVVWTAGNRFGVSTREPINIAAMIGQSPSSSATASGSSPSHARPSEVQKLSPATVQERYERSRKLSSLFEYVVFGGCVLVAAITLSGAVFKTLSSPFGQVSSGLEPVG